MGIFADILGALASAPVMAAGATTKGLGEAIKHGAGDIPALQVTGDIISGLGDHGLAAANSISEGFSNLELSGGVSLAALGRGMSGMGFTSLTPGSRENSVALARAPEIEAPSVAPALPQAVLPPTIQDVQLASLGDLAPPAVGGGAPAQSAGISV